jgi:hypothetical protein
MSVDRILQLKLIADVQDINSKMQSASAEVGKMSKAFTTMKSLAVPAMIGLGSTITSNVVGALSDAVTRAGDLRDELVSLDSLSVSLGLDEGNARAVLDALTKEAQGLGFGDEVVIADAFGKALQVTEDVDSAVALVRAGFDQARASGEDLGESMETAFDAIIGGGDEAEEKLGVFGETFDERLASFNDKYGNFAEDFALTDEGEWQTINAEFDGYVMDLATIVDEFILDFKSGIVDGLQGWKDSIDEHLPLIRDGLATKFGEAFQAVKAAVVGGLNAIIGAWNMLDFSIDFDVNINTGNGDINKALGMPETGLDFSFHSGDLIPDVGLIALAAGGIVRQPTLALVGEAGPEAVVPLDRDMGGDRYTINVYAAAAAPADVGREVVRAIEAYERRAGTAWRS